MATETKTHVHRWARYYEDSIIGIGPLPIGYKCVDCDEFVSQDRVTPNLGGIVLDEKHLLGSHGGRGQCADGSTYKEQIYKNGILEIIR